MRRKENEINNHQTGLDLLLFMGGGIAGQCPGSIPYLVDIDHTDRKPGWDTLVIDGQTRITEDYLLP